MEVTCPSACTKLGITPRSGEEISIKIVGAENVHRLLDYPGLIEALADAHCRDRPLNTRVLFETPDEAGGSGEGFLVLPAWAPGRAFGAKLVTLMPTNDEVLTGLPTIQAVFVLFDGKTGSPRAIIDGTSLTLRKTAADSALGARLLAREDAHTLLMVGAGALAPHLIRAHRIARPSIERVFLWNRTTTRRAAVIDRLGREGLTVEPSDDLETAVRVADIVCTATRATEPLIRGAWLKAGTHVDLVGSYIPAMREADDEAISRASVFVDFRGPCVKEAGDLAQPIAAGVIGEDDVLADLFELARGDHHGRSAVDEVTLFKNGGGGHLDLFTAEYLIQRRDAEVNTAAPD
jgi:ornithine cyclodeaminase